MKLAIAYLALVCFLTGKGVYETPREQKVGLVSPTWGITLSERKDTEEAQIDNYLCSAKVKSPLCGLGKTFWEAGHLNRIDPLYLVAISMVESSGGRHYLRHTNNFMGWNHGRHPFPSRADCIMGVARKSATLPAYKTFRKTGGVKELSLAYNKPYWKDYQGKLEYFIGKIKKEGE